MPSFLEVAVNIFTVPLVLLGSLFIAVTTAVLLDGVVGLVVLLARLLRLNFRTLIEFQSALLATWFSLFMGHNEHTGGLTLKVTGDAFRRDDTAVIVCTHRTWIDTLVLYSLARQVNRHGDVKFLAKYSLLFFPVFGLAGLILDAVVFIEREASQAGQRLSKVFARLTDPRRERHPFWLIIYPEGTRRTAAKLHAAQAFAKKRDLKVLNHVLQPRTKGFVSCVHALRGTATAIYDITIAYGDDPDAEVTPSFLCTHFTTALSERVVHVHQRRIPIENVPKDDEDSKKWLYKLYEQKDALLDGYYKNKKFDGPPMRWNRMTYGYWFKCAAIWLFAVAAFVVVMVKVAGVLLVK